MISSTNLVSSYFIRDTGRASSQPSGNLSNSFPDGIPVGNLIPLMRREFPMGSHNLLFGYRFLSCSDPKLNLGGSEIEFRNLLIWSMRNVNWFTHSPLAVMIVYLGSL